MYPILRITDGTTVVNLLSSGTGILLKQWQPAIAEAKDGGVWRSSPLSEGRRLVQRQMGNAIERFTLTVNGCEQDNVIRDTQNLRRLLEQAVEYWTTDWAAYPVWIESRAPNETNTRYALIYDWRTPSDNNPFAQPFFGKTAIIDNFELMVERGHWLSSPPSEEECAQISSRQTAAADSTFTASVVAATDDGTPEELYPYGPVLFMGRIGKNPWITGVRFQNVTIPPNAQIINAFITFEAYGSESSVDCIAIIGAELTEDAATLGPGPGLHERFYRSTVNWVDWDIPTIVAGNTYDTPNLAALITELTDQTDWASGGDIMFLFKPGDGCADNSYRRFSSYDDTVGAAPLLTIYYIDPTVWFGRDETCEAEVVVANHHIQTQISHIYRYDASEDPPWSSNLHAMALPTDLFPDPLGIGDCLYLGSRSSWTLFGPFASAIFDLANAAPPGFRVAWEYPTSVGPPIVWEAMELNDDTFLGWEFGKTGVCGAYWPHEQGNGSWVQCNPGVGNGWYIRARIYDLGVTITPPPRQQNRRIYTAVRPSVDLATARIGGDIPALARVQITNKSFYEAGTPEYSLTGNHYYLALRSQDRGPFWSHLNCSSLQNMEGIFFYEVSPGNVISYVQSPTGQCLDVPNSLGTTLAMVGQWPFAGEAMQSYRGTYRIFLRYEMTAFPSADWYTAQLVVRNGSVVQYGDVIDLPFTLATSSPSRFHIADMGLFTFGPGVPTTENLTFTNIWLYAAENGASGALYVYDLILMPTDEWFAELISPAEGAPLLENYMLNVDGINYPKDPRRALRKFFTGSVYERWTSRMNGIPILQANKDQTLYLLCTQYHEDAGVTEYISDHEAAHIVELFKAQRYFSMRGLR